MTVENRTFQARLGAKEDIIRRKLIGNNLSLIGDPTDIIRIKAKKSDELDILSSLILKADIISVLFPSLVDIPFRWIEKKDGTLEYSISSLVNIADEEESKKCYTVTVPYGTQFDVDDILVRVLLDPNISRPSVLTMKVADQLGTFGHGMMLYAKYSCVLYTEDIDVGTLAVIVELAKRRLNLGF